MLTPSFAFLFGFVLLLEICSSLEGNCPENCLLLPKGGPCLGRKRFRMWYYDFKVGECAKFSYGGCRGNKNRFWEQEECEGLCKEKCNEQKEGVSRCSLPLDLGAHCENPDVKPSILWHYDSQSKKCEPFAFTGCGGNVNKFESQNECTETCAISFGMSGKEQLDWDKTEAVNITGTINVINACADVGVRGLVYTSTFNVVFGGQEIHNGTEDLPYFPLHRHVDHYSRTKSIAEQLILTSDKKSSLRTCALRLAGVMGLKEKRHLPRIVDNLWMLKFTYGKRDSLVQFISIENVVQAHVKAALGLLNNSTQIGGQAFFISDGIPINNFEYFRPLIEGLGYTFPTLNLPLWIMWIFSYLSMALPWLIPLLTPAEIYKTAINHYFSNDKATRLLDYQPTHPNDLTSVVEYYKNKQKQSRKQQPRFSPPLLTALICTILSIVFFMWLL